MGFGSKEIRLYTLTHPGRPMIKQINDMLKSDYLTAKEITELVLRYQKSRKKDIKEAYKNAVFNNVIRLISKRASQSAALHRNLEMEDLFQAGVIGFCEALEKFKPKKKFMFSTYLDFWIKKYMYDLSYNSHLIYTPKNVIQFAFQQERNKIEGKKSTHNERSQMFLKTENILFLDSDAGGNMHDLIKSGIEIDADIDTVSRSEYLQKIIKRYLNESEQKVIKLRYFNGSGEIRKLQAVGEMINLSTERVRQIESDALVKLRKRSKDLIQ